MSKKQDKEEFIFKDTKKHIQEHWNDFTNLKMPKIEVFIVADKLFRKVLKKQGYTKEELKYIDAFTEDVTCDNCYNKGHPSHYWISMKHSVASCLLLDHELTHVLIHEIERLYKIKLEKDEEE